jgi:RecA/RadA recombinase
MARNSKWMEKLQKLEGAVNREYDPWNDVIRSPSPSVNFTFGRTHGLPRGFVLTIFGPPRHGKSMLINSMIGQMHKDDPDAICVKYNTEMREGIQVTKKDLEVFGIDENRYMAFDTNEPKYIFDPIEHEVAAMCQDGAPIKLLVIDSTSFIRGRRSLNADTIETQQIGDHALTMKDGLSRILSVIRKYKIATILTCHVAAEMDPHLQRKYGPYKMGGAYALKHFSEFMMLVERDDTAAGRVNLLGKEFVNEDVKDGYDKAESTGLKVRVTMKESPIGNRNRMGQFALDFKQGMINQHEEVFKLGVNRGIVQRPNNRTYVFHDRQWVGKESFIQALSQDEDLCREIIKELRADDIKGVSRQISTEEGPTEEVIAI